MNPKTNPHRLIILCGPSGVGKTPLTKALQKMYPNVDKKLKRIVLHNSRLPRPDEREAVDYYFQNRDQIQALKNDINFLVLNVRGDLQAVNLKEILQLVRSFDVIYEGNTFMGNLLRTHPRLNQVNKLSVILSPITKDEILYFQEQNMDVSLAQLIKGIMKNKLMRRAQNHAQNISKKILANIEERASDAFSELTEAWKFDYIIPNHDGEDSDNWKVSGLPLGDARKAVIALAALIKGNGCDYVEKWEEGLV
jgi:guanylate kinase